jgi:hypothetical protein
MPEGELLRDNGAPYRPPIDDFAAVIWAAPLGILPGSLAGRRHGSWIDRAIMALSVVGVSVPVFWIGLLLMNWKDKETDDKTRTAAYRAVQEKVHDAAVWIPLFHEPLFLVTGAKLKPIKAHGN